MSEIIPRIVSVGGAKHGAVLRTADNRVIYEPLLADAIEGAWHDDRIIITLDMSTPPETAVTDTAELRLQDALNEKAERTTALDVALQGLADLRQMAHADARISHRFWLVANGALEKAEAYRAEEIERLNAGLRERRDRGLDEVALAKLTAECDDANRQADQFAAEIGSLQQQLAAKQNELASVQAQRNYYKSVLVDINGRLTDMKLTG